MTNLEDPCTNFKMEVKARKTLLPLALIVSVTVTQIPCNRHKFQLFFFNKFCEFLIKELGNFGELFFSSVNLTNVAKVLEKFTNLIQQNWKRKRKRTLVHQGTHKINKQCCTMHWWLMDSIMLKGSKLPIDVVIS